MGDVEVLVRLQQLLSVWSQSSVETLIERQGQLKQVLSLLDEGLRSHFSFEEKFMSRLLGKVLTKAFMHEHKDIVKKIEKAKALVSDTKLEGLSQQELLSAKSGVWQSISDVWQALEQHGAAEETIFKMLERTLQSGGQ